MPKTTPPPQATPLLQQQDKGVPFSEGEIAINVRALDKILEYVDNAISMDPNHPILHQIRGTIGEYLSRVDDIEEHFPHATMMLGDMINALGKEALRTIRNQANTPLNQYRDDIVGLVSLGIDASPKVAMAKEARINADEARYWTKDLNKSKFSRDGAAVVHGPKLKAAR